MKEEQRSKYLLPPVPHVHKRNPNQQYYLAHSLDLSHPDVVKVYIQDVNSLPVHHIKQKKDVADTDGNLVQNFVNYSTNQNQKNMNKI